MTRDDIARMAREAGVLSGYDSELFQRFAALVIANHPPQSSMAWQEGYEAGAAAEREACAKVCDAEIAKVKPLYSVVAENCAKAIRARGEK